MHRRWRRWLNQVEWRTRRLLRALVAPNPARRAGIWRLRFLCPVLPPVEQIMLSWSCRDLLVQLWRSYLCFSFSRTELVLSSERFVPRDARSEGRSKLTTRTGASTSVKAVNLLLLRVRQSTNRKIDNRT